MSDLPNLILIISDTLRADFLGCYGNSAIYTPEIDAFAEESTCFEEVYPESLPTIPVRRALHTGRRAFPFNDYEPIHWDTVYLPGWQPISREEDTVAENLVDKGFYTGFVSDVRPYFGPAMNFTRGFWQWKFVRGQQADRWKSPATVDKSKLKKYGNPEEMLEQFPYNLVLRHLANTQYIESEEDTTTAHVFRWAMDFLDDNRNVGPLYLLVDAFDPHEPWRAPDSYYEMYADDEYTGNTIIHVKYGPMEGRLEPKELENIKAHYSGLVSLVDNWFGNFIRKLKRLDLYENSLIIFTSDHGTNFGENAGKIVGKPHYALYPGVMHIPLLMKFPNGKGSGEVFDELVSNIDIPATIYDLAGFEKSNLNIDGKSLFDLVNGSNNWEERSYLTCRYDETVWYRDDSYWVISDISGETLGVYDIREDPKCMNNLKEDMVEVAEDAYKKILEDADGSLPSYEDVAKTDAIGQPRETGDVLPRSDGE